MDKEKFSSYLDKYLHLISLYLNKKTIDFSIDEETLNFFVNISKSHSLLALLYKALNDTKVDIPSDKLKKLEEYYLSILRKDVLFNKERNELFKFLSDNQIDYLPLKGLVIKQYYLDPYTREYADNDILFSSKDELIKKFFVKRGYKVESYKKGNHDVYIKKPFYNFEMHRALFMKGAHDDKFVEYFDNYLKEAPIKEGHEHYLSKENFYIYFLAHSHKHFDGSGCGIRTLIDIYVYLKNNELDVNYINQELEKIGLLDFSNKISNLSNNIFDQKQLSEEEKETLLYIASSGTYGTLENSVSKGVKEKGKFGYFMARVFPPYSFYKTAYPWAYKSVILIPIAWTIRTFRVLFKNPKKAKKELSLISKTKEDKSNE